MTFKNWDDYKAKYIERTIEYTKEKLSELEQKMDSPIERIAYIQIADVFEDYISARTVTFKPQMKIGPYVADFYFKYKDASVCFEAIIECDGHEFHEKTKEQASNDRARDRFLTKRGFYVLRYTGSSILKEPEVITSDLFEIIHLREDFRLGFGLETFGMIGKEE